MESILTSLKSLVDPGNEYPDQEIIIYINGAIATLTQIGVGPKTGFIVKDASATWTDFIGARQDAEFVKSYLYLKLRLIFDPPQSGFLVDAIKEQATELEWRLNMQAEGGTIV